MGHYLEGHSTSPRVMIPATRAFHQTALSGAHGFRSHRLRLLLMLCKYCRIRVNSCWIDMARLALVPLYKTSDAPTACPLIHKSCAESWVIFRPALRSSPRKTIPVLLSASRPTRLHLYRLIRR